MAGSLFLPIPSRRTPTGAPGAAPSLLPHQGLQTPAPLRDRLERSLCPEQTAALPAPALVTSAPQLSPEGLRAAERDAGRWSQALRGVGARPRAPSVCAQGAPQGRKVRGRPRPRHPPARTTLPPPPRPAAGNEPLTGTPAAKRPPADKARTATHTPRPEVGRGPAPRASGAALGARGRRPLGGSGFRRPRSGLCAAAAGAPPVPERTCARAVSSPGAAGAGAAAGRSSTVGVGRRGEAPAGGGSLRAGGPASCPGPPTRRGAGSGPPLPAAGGVAGGVPSTAPREGPRTPCSGRRGLKQKSGLVGELTQLVSGQPTAAGARPYPGRVAGPGRAAEASGDRPPAPRAGAAVRLGPAWRGGSVGNSRAAGPHLQAMHGTLWTTPGPGSQGRAMRGASRSERGTPPPPIHGAAGEGAGSAARATLPGSCACAATLGVVPCVRFKPSGGRGTYHLIVRLAVCTERCFKSARVNAHSWSGAPAQTALCTPPD